MSVVGITFKGAQGSGKTRLLYKISEFLNNEGFSIIVFDDLHGINVIDPLEVLNQKESKDS